METLDLNQTLVSELPIEINRLRKMRHLLPYSHDYGLDFSLASQKGVKIQKGVGCLEELQKLYFVDLNHGGVDLIKDYRKVETIEEAWSEKPVKGNREGFVCFYCNNEPPSIS